MPRTNAADLMTDVENLLLISFASLRNARALASTCS
jgi:hypothetical protein